MKKTFAIQHTLSPAVSDPPYVSSLNYMLEWNIPWFLGKSPKKFIGKRYLLHIWKQYTISIHNFHKSFDFIRLPSSMISSCSLRIHHPHQVLIFIPSFTFYYCLQYLHILCTQVQHYCFYLCKPLQKCALFVLLVF